MRIKGYNFFKMFLFLFVFSTLIVKFLAKLRLESLQNLMEKQYFYKKNRFHLFKKHLQQNWRAENMPVVSRCLVSIVMRGRMMRLSVIIKIN